VGLSGEIRPVNRVDQRIQEAENWVFDILCLSTTKLLSKIPKIELVAKIEDVARRFGCKNNCST
jgi:DNA repair protein RadA/Sms